MSKVENPISRFVSARDGLKLHVRIHGPKVVAATPVVCLPGLARTTADFEDLAATLASDVRQPRQVAALDYRGRGLSDYDRNPANYNLAVELADVLAVLTALGIGRAVFVGTSRGGILAMLLATARPATIAGVVLNDIGPVIEPKGLVRIKGYVGRLPQPRDFQEGAEILRRLFDAHFPKLAPADWLAFAHRTFRERDGKLVPCHDPKLAAALKGVQAERAPAPLWREFAALSALPLMVIRGANSDILSAATLAAMSSHRPDIDVLEIPDQGHAPLLTGDDVISRISAFIARC